ncbi:hypothetical protein CMV_025513 [Castanea mollissima]|uniref:Guanine nucleotide-binding protein subunit beta-like protein n=1 Tax=Castanea mollissima TaxID=60419 RepID=A0A8J4QD48_9ROSI|nr:hypothetical protein CMV_025513 [Castanea mollissima]
MREIDRPLCAPTTATSSSLPRATNPSASGTSPRTGHSHFVEDVVLSSDGQFALSGSWDGELRLWDLQAGVSARRFVGHTKDVLSVAFSINNRQIVSASHDRTIKLWNTRTGSRAFVSLGECFSCVHFTPTKQI